MTARALYTLVFAGVMLLTALSVGSAGAFLLGAAALSAFALSLVGVLSAFFTCRLSQHMPSGQVSRGDSCPYTLAVRLFSPMPIAPLTLRVCLPSGRQSEYMLTVRLFGKTESDNRFSCPHVGVFPVGVTHVTFSDCFGLFHIPRAVRDPLGSVTVLPNPKPSQPLSYSPGEGETSMALRAQADRTTPADTRAWQDGDDVKRVHWKLSMRRGELMVHTYETPQRPDALVLLDGGAPALPGGSRAEGAARASLIDALTETAAGVLSDLLEAGRPVRLPLAGGRSAELSGQESSRLPHMLAALAREPFSQPADFVRTLLLAARRLQRTGSAVVLSSRLTPAVADALIAFSRMGPRTRFILVSSGGATGEQLQLLKLLESSGVETEQAGA